MRPARPPPHLDSSRVTGTADGTPTFLGGVVAVASWDNGNDITVALDLDWTAFGLTATAASIAASPIAGFQPALQLDAAKPVLQVPAKQGWLLNVRPREERANA